MPGRATLADLRARSESQFLITAPSVIAATPCVARRQLCFMFATVLHDLVTLFR